MQKFCKGEGGGGGGRTWGIIKRGGCSCKSFGNFKGGGGGGARLTQGRSPLNTPLHNHTYILNYIAHLHSTMNKNEYVV